MPDHPRRFTRFTCFTHVEDETSETRPMLPIGADGADIKRYLPGSQLLSPEGNPSNCHPGNPPLPPVAARLCRSKSVTNLLRPHAPLALARCPRTLREKRLRDSPRPHAAAACRRPCHRRYRSRGETRPEVPLPTSPRGGDNRPGCVLPPNHRKCLKSTTLT